MRAIKIGRVGLAATAWLAGMSLAWLGWAATPAGTPTPADFSQCAACHSTQPGQNKIGPSLAGVFGRTSGSVPGYNYSAALKNAHLTWDELLIPPNDLAAVVKRRKAEFRRLAKLSLPATVSAVGPEAAINLNGKETSAWTPSLTT